MESTLLLDCSYQPLDIIPWKEAVRLWFLGKAEVIEEHEAELRSTYLVIKMPAVVRLTRLFRKKKKKVKFSRAAIYTRDKQTCQYCGMKGTARDFTFDHVIPKSRGGRTNWENIVTACKPCNLKKANRTPSEAGMALLSKPKMPDWLPLLNLRVSLNDIPDTWSSYLFWTGIIKE
jgi:5-methylcytosine-specific restriction endonuclease McrA